MRWHHSTIPTTKQVYQESCLSCPGDPINLPSAQILRTNRVGIIIVVVVVGKAEFLGGFARRALYSHAHDGVHVHVL